jgi:hypothetical protein
MDGRFYIRQMEWMEMDAQTSISIHSIHLKKCVEWIATLAVSGYRMIDSDEGAHSCRLQAL